MKLHLKPTAARSFLSLSIPQRLASVEQRIAELRGANHISSIYEREKVSSTFDRLLVASMELARIDQAGSALEVTPDAERRTQAEQAVANYKRGPAATPALSPRASTAPAPSIPPAAAAVPVAATPALPVAAPHVQPPAADVPKPPRWATMAVALSELPATDLQKPADNAPAADHLRYYNALIVFALAAKAGRYHQQHRQAINQALEDERDQRP